MFESIAYAKNNLPQLIYKVQEQDPVILTRRGEPVAVLQSYAQYQAQSASNDNWFSRAMRWREENMDLIKSINLTDEQIDSWRSREMPSEDLSKYIGE